MGVIATAEDVILASVTAALSGKVRNVESLSGPWTMQALRRALQFAPCIRVAWLGGKPTDAENASINARFGIYFIAGQPTDAGRRRGTPQAIGAYDMIEAIAPLLNEMVVAGIGTLYLTNITPMFTEQTLELGGSVYASLFELRNMVLSMPVNPGAYADFITFHADSDIAPADADIDITSEETLPI